MRNMIRMIALAAVLLTSIPAAQAVVQNYSFDGTLDSGLFAGQNFSGSFSFDDLGQLTNNGFYIFGLTGLNMSLAGRTYTLTDALAPADVSYLDGEFLGVSYSSAPVGNLDVTLIADSAAPYLTAYTSNDFGGSGTINYAQVPEPESYALVLSALGLLGVVARRRTKSV